MIPSETAQRIAGTFIEDDQTPKAPLIEWLQSECRIGRFRKILEEAAAVQDEPLRVDLALIDSVSAECISVKVPCRVSDHESASTFSTDVYFSINPLALRASRV